MEFFLDKRHERHDHIPTMAKKRPSKRGGRIPPPKCKAILLCDQTILEAGTNKISVIGVFDNFTMATFPAMVKPFTAFLNLTDGIGRYAVTVEVHDLAQDIILARAVGPEVVFPDRSTKINLIIPVPGLPLHHAGNYDFVVFANGQEIDRQQFQAQLLQGGEHAGNPTQEPD